MKKYILITFICICIPVFLHAQTTQQSGAQTVQRNNIMPGFFIPNGALQTNNRAEKLPPVESIGYRQKMSDAVQQHQQQQIRQQQIKQQQQQAAQGKENAATLGTTAKTTQTTGNSFMPTKIKSADKPSIIPEPTTTPNKKIDTIPSNAEETQPTLEEITPSASTIKSNIADNPNTATATTAMNTPKTENNTSPAATNPAKNAFDIIIEEYRQDLIDIGQGKYTPSKRLKEILDDYINKEHAF